MASQFKCATCGATAISFWQMREHCRTSGHRPVQQWRGK